MAKAPAEKKVRLDSLLVRQRLAASRERARALILAGRVRLGDTRVQKAGTLVPADATLTLDAPDHPYVSRGGVKLDHALDHFGVRVAQRTALDIGASTGGFTDVLLRRGAAHVVALDVGRGQLAWALREDPRVTVLERVNARALGDAPLPPEHRRVDVVTIDVSFISLRLILPGVPACLRPDADVIALVKPQFEAGRREVGPRGIVRDPAVWARVVEELSTAARAVGLRTRGSVASPIAGMEGNREFFLWLGPCLADHEESTS